MRGIRCAAVLLLLWAVPAVLEAQAGTVQLSSANYTFQEGDGVVTITLTRTGGSSGVASVEVDVVGGTANLPEDYSIPPTCVGPPCPPITWADGDSAPKTVSISIIDDTLGEPSETVLLALSEPQGATIGVPGSATVTILDNDPALVIPTLDDSGKLLLFCLFGATGTLLLRRQKKRL